LLALEKRCLGGAVLVIGIGILSILVASCEKPAEESGLSLLEWNGFQHPQYYPEYLEKYGKQPNYTFFAHTNDALKRMRSGLKVDLVHLCTGQMQEAMDEALIIPIDTDRLPRWGAISPELLELPDVRIDGEYWLVPWEWGYSTVGYNPEFMDVDSPSFDIFVDPRFKGMTALPSDTEVNLWIAGIIGRWADPMDPTEEEMQAAPEIFRRMLENARFIWTDSTQLEQAWATGDVGISYIYGSASRRMVREGLPVVVIEPLLTWMCGLSLSTTGVGSDDEAYDYINAMMDPASGVALFDDYGYGHVNANTVKLIDADRVVGTGIDDPAGTFARGVYSKALPPAKKARLLQLWYEAQASLN
jgi:spermidine/putrescine-binding protein